MAKDLIPGALSPTFGAFVSLRGQVYFTTIAGHVHTLWVSDGSEAAIGRRVIVRAGPNHYEIDVGSDATRPVAFPGYVDARAVGHK